MNYTCVSCGLAFNDATGQRDHMKSDWHRYNLKRRVAQLPAIDEATFNSKIAVHSSAEEAGSQSSTRKQLTKKDLRHQQKEALQKQKQELLAVRQAIQSKLSLEQENLSDSPTDDSKNKIDVSSTDEVTHQDTSKEDEITEEDVIKEKLANRVEITPTTCLFCPEKSSVVFETVDENISHMFKDHGLYVPETKYLVDKEGLLSYLGEKIGLGNVCLVCSYQGKNVGAVREHMKTKRHMKIPYETENEKLEISDFYDFSSTYQDLPLPSNSDANDEDWEDVSGDEESEDEAQDDIPVDENPIINMGVELVLPSGAVVGHRSMAKYYRQNLPPEKVLSEGQGTVIAAESRHFVSAKDKKELSLQKRAWGREKKRDDVNDRRAAKFINNQPHFRDPLLQ